MAATAAATMTDGASRRKAAGSKRHRPLDYDARPLDYDALLATLDLLDGETVCIPVLHSAQEWGTAFEVTGTLHRARPDDAFFKIGDSGYLLLVESNFVSASLSTLEGNFYFRIEIVLRTGTIELGDPELLGLALSDYPPGHRARS